TQVGVAPSCELLRDSDRLVVTTSRRRATASWPPPPRRFCSRAGVAPPSVARPSAPASIESCDITILPFTTQINDAAVAPAGDGAFKPEVIFCVQGVITPPCGEPSV